MDEGSEAMATAERRARARWKGTLTDGQGEVSLESSGVLSGAGITWAARTEEPHGLTSPEELLAAANAACYAMALSGALAQGATPADSLEVSATCAFDKKNGRFAVTTMDLSVQGVVPGIDQATFQDVARKAEEGCPISNAIRGNVEISLQAGLKQA
jgi:lipoyl-dependent peroxiredoxin